MGQKRVQPQPKVTEDRVEQNSQHSKYFDGLIFSVVFEVGGQNQLVQRHDIDDQAGKITTPEQEDDTKSIDILHEQLKLQLESLE